MAAMPLELNCEHVYTTELAIKTFQNCTRGEIILVPQWKKVVSTKVLGKKSGLSFGK